MLCCVRLAIAQSSFSLGSLGLFWFGLFPCLKKIARKIPAGKKRVGEKTQRGKDLAGKRSCEEKNQRRKIGVENTSGEMTGGEKTQHHCFSIFRAHLDLFRSKIFVSFLFLTLVFSASVQPYLYFFYCSLVLLSHYKSVGEETMVILDELYCVSEDLYVHRPMQGNKLTF